VINLQGYFFITCLHVEVDWFMVNDNGIVIRLSTQVPTNRLDFSTGRNKNVTPPGRLPQSFVSAIQPRLTIDASDKSWRFPRLLACWSTVASLTLTGETRPWKESRDLWRKCGNLQILNENGDWVGSIMMHNDWIADEVESPRQFQFILLSRSEDLQYADPPALYDEALFVKRPWCLLNVMMIDILNPEGDIAQRLGVGFIHEDAWIGAHPQPRLMKLM